MDLQTVRQRKAMHELAPGISDLEVYSAIGLYIVAAIVIGIVGIKKLLRRRNGEQAD